MNRLAKLRPPVLACHRITSILSFGTSTVRIGELVTIVLIAVLFAPPTICSAPDAQQDADGTIYLVWDFERSKEQEILLTTFREEDVLAADNEARARVLASRRLVSKGGVE